MTTNRSRHRSTNTRFAWRHLKLAVTHTPNYINHGWSHLELRVIAPKGAPCPLTSTGYLSVFLDIEELIAAGGPVVYLCARLEQAAKTKAWSKAESAWRQLDLFG